MIVAVERGKLDRSSDPKDQLRIVNAASFFDDTLNLRKKWFIELCDKIVSMGFDENTFFKGLFRVDENILSEEIFLKAKKQLMMINP